MIMHRFSPLKKGFQHTGYSTNLRGMLMRWMSTLEYRGGLALKHRMELGGVVFDTKSLSDLEPLPSCTSVLHMQIPGVL